MNKKFALLALISLSANADYKTLNITTTLDVNNLYKNSINSIEFFPSLIELEVSEDRTKFATTETTLKVETDIPKEIDNISYVTRLVKNEANCKDFSGVVHPQEGFMNLTIDQNPITVGKSVLFSDFSLDNGVNKYSEHNVALSFATFEEIITSGQPESCYGEIEFSVEVEI